MYWMKWRTILVIATTFFRCLLRSELLPNRTYATADGLAADSCVRRDGAIHISVVLCVSRLVRRRGAPERSPDCPATLYLQYAGPAGEKIVLYANGFGATSTAIVSGSAVRSGTLATLPVIRIGGVEAQVLFAGYNTGLILTG